MLDCGSGCHSMLHYPNDLQNLAVILSHLHRDHYKDIYNLQYASFVFHNQKRLEHPIHIYLPSTPSSIFQDITTESNAFTKYTTIVKEASISYGFPEISSHLTAKQAGIIAKEAKVNTLMLTHFWPEESPETFVAEAQEVFQNVIPAEEGKIIDLT